MLKITALLIIIVTIIFTYQSINGKPMKTLQTTDTILAFGDSLTYGYNASPEQSYPTLLSHKTGLKVINAGIPGDTSYDGLRRLPEFLKNDSIKLMILFLGGNDILQQFPISELKSNLSTMIQMAQKREIAVLLISVPNLSMFGFSPLGLYQDIANEADIPLLEGMYSDILEDPSLKSDQIHPNAKGYRKMAEEIYEKLRKEGFI